MSYRLHSTTSEASIPLKPTQVDPKKFMDAVRSMDEKTKEAAAASKVEGEKPREVTELSDADFQYATVSDAYGSDWQRGMDARKKFEKWMAPLGTCEETRYADSFHTMTGKSPFAKK